MAPPPLGLGGWKSIQLDVVRGVLLLGGRSKNTTEPGGRRVLVCVEEGIGNVVFPQEQGVLDRILGLRALTDAVKTSQKGSSQPRAAPDPAHFREKSDPVEGGGGETSHFSPRLFCKRRVAVCTALRACKRPYSGSCGPVPFPFPLFPRGTPSPRRPRATGVGRGGEGRGAPS